MRPTPPESRWRVPGRGGPSGLRGARKRQPVPRLRDGVARTRASWRRLPDQAAIGCARIVREEEEGGGGKEGGGRRRWRRQRGRRWRRRRWQRGRRHASRDPCFAWPAGTPFSHRRRRRRPSLGCPLGRSLPRLPMGSRPGTVAARFSPDGGPPRQHPAVGVRGSIPRVGPAAGASPLLLRGFGLALRPLAASPPTPRHRRRRRDAAANSTGADDADDVDALAAAAVAVATPTRHGEYRVYSGALLVLNKQGGFAFLV